jgi:hypothetical protein
MKDDEAPPGQRRRRFRPGSGSSGGWSPFLSSSSAADADPDDDREREIQIIVRALADRGELQRKELVEVTGCKYWGPGRFGAALRAALDQGRVRKVGRARYGL